MRNDSKVSNRAQERRSYRIWKEGGHEHLDHGVHSLIQHPSVESTLGQTSCET